MTDSVPPVLRAAARGELPDWARADQPRRRHSASVAGLMAGWAKALALPDAEQERWRAAAWLHDALRLAGPSELLPLVPQEFRDLPARMLHGPAAAARLRQDGVSDEALLLAISHHTIGHPAFDILGKALYAADFLEPGRTFDPLLRAGLRARMPAGMAEVVPAIVRLRLIHLLRSGRRIRAETLAFWNRLAEQADA
jgi:2-amino-4-hydroxy-6-hydroxymethyldihydropteridine diphosphokinase